MVETFLGLPLLPRFKMFSWKFLHDALPLSSTVCPKGLPVNPVLIFCHSDLETVSHLFRDCPFISPLWEQGPLTLDGRLLQAKPFNEWFTNLMSDFQRSKNFGGLVSFVSFLWAIWLMRNQCIFRQAVWSPSMTFHLSADWVARVTQAGVFQNQLSSSYRIRSPPLESFMSLRLSGGPTDPLDHCLLFDGAWNCHDNSAGAGCIFREIHSDRVLGGSARAGRTMPGL
ncbi:uncharacterized protein LOC110700204 [Chenopodium quinoa]|uniref:uncharacterized protein LOC110700204 n=1 Tax=Chenopodium quinoa TaxID=63459 RepID=UPI000B78DDDF|nr:uncharacterized protein LOC110700204 [Chenopodium quinoa]